MTSGFVEYDVEKVIQEYKETASDSESEFTLPQSVGGTKVHLIMGIKNTRIQPTLLYLSLFKDIWGSRIITKC